MLQRLKAADRLAELLAHAQILESELLSPFHDAEEFGRNCDQGEVCERLDSSPRGLPRRHEIRRSVLEFNSRQHAAIDSRRSRNSNSGAITRRVVECRSVRSLGADQKSVGAISAYRSLRPGQTRLTPAGRLRPQ